MEESMTKSYLWGEHTIDESIHAFTVGSDLIYDTILLPYDVQATKAHVKMLHTIGFLTKLELKTLSQRLDELLASAQDKNLNIPETFEDSHSFIEHYLSDCDDAGKKIHFLRSRNDQALTALRLYQLDMIDKIFKSTCTLASHFKQKNRKFNKTVMPGYTHLQPAMPTTVGTWLESFGDALLDTTILLHATRNILDQNPLGSGAGFGFMGQAVIPDTILTTTQLGFARTQKNPMYSAMSRGLFELYFVQAINCIAVIISQYAQDMLLFTMKEFTFFSLPRNFTTGSSIMPQKKNYDCIELLRSQVALVQGNYTQIQAIVSKKSSGYQRDLQLTKKPLIESVNLILDSLKICEHIVKNIEVHEEKLAKAVSHELFATAKANSLVAKGVSFRDAYVQTKKEYDDESNE
jgi:argininosuccinate lyase